MNVNNSDVGGLTLFDDGSGAGPALYAVGLFTMAGGMSASHIAKWDGIQWSPLGNGLTPATANTTSVAVFNDGTGDALYAGGQFTMAGGVPANHIARWDGSQWSALGVGGDLDGEAVAMAVFNDGTGDALYVAGNFSNAGGVPGTNRIARWDGTSWSAVGGGANNSVIGLALLQISLLG